MLKPQFCVTPDEPQAHLGAYLQKTLFYHQVKAKEMGAQTALTLSGVEGAVGRDAKTQIRAKTPISTRA